MSKPIVSVCLITYNQAKYVREAIDSILAQKLDVAWELVIADDYSTDGTREILAEYKDKYPDLIKLILQTKNVGAEKNWHDLMAYPKSKYIAYLEGDDYWSDEYKLQMQVDFLEKHPDYVLSFHPAKVFYENGEDKQSVWPNITDKSKITTPELLKENFIPSNSAVYRRQNYDKLPKGIMPGDWYFHLYHAQFGKMGFINKAMSSYRRHSGGLWWDSFSNQDTLWRKYGLGYVALYVELLKIYGEDKVKQQIIYHGLSKALGNLVSVDKRFDEHLLHQALKSFPDAIEPFIISQHETTKDQAQELEANKHEIDQLTQTVVELRSQVFKLRDELHVLKGSRVIGRIIKFREYLGVQIPRIKRLPKTGPRRIKAFVFGFVPESVKIQLRRGRSLLKRVARKLTGKISSQEKRYVTVPVRPIKAGEPLVSVIIPYYNRGDTIDDTLDSLDAQTFRNFETILVNDGSPDPDSIKKLEQIKTKRPYIHFIDQENQGVAAARNTGVQQARGRYVICLDSDDVLDTTFIEKCTLVLETTPDVSLVTTHMDVFGVINEPFQHTDYDPLVLYGDNMVITAAEFTKQAWKATGGYKSKIGYEDWEHWLNLAEHGFWGKTLPEPLFKYRVAMQSRYVEDKDIHWNNVRVIHSLHNNYKKTIKRLRAQRKQTMQLVEPEQAFINMSRPEEFMPTDSSKKNILITVPWMTFGGAETLIYNYTREVKDKFNLSFVTGLKSDNEWEYKFREITPNIYHLPNLFQDERLYVEFISNYIKTRNIDTLHIIHNGFTFGMLPELKKRHPKLKVIVTLFNDRVEYFDQSVESAQYIDAFTSDNAKVANHFVQAADDDTNTVVIPNGINCYYEFNPERQDRPGLRKELELADDELAVFFVGRLSPEKNPNVFLDTAKQILIDDKRKKLKFFIVGDGPIRPEVERQMKEIGSKDIVYLGYQSDVAKYFSAADIFVLPSSIEGFPLSILEAMAMRVAVVASDVGAIAEVIEDGVEGFVVPPGSTPDFVKAIELLQDEPERLEAIKKAARQKVEKTYSNRLLGSNYQRLYNEATR